MIKNFIVIAGFLGAVFLSLAQDIIPATEKLVDVDWLIKPVTAKAAVYKSQDGRDLILYNGLVKRSFRISPNVACIEYKNMVNGQQLLRAVKPEAIIKIDGKEINVGGLYGQKENAYLKPEWVDQFVQHDDGYRVLKDIRSSPAHWEEEKKKTTTQARKK